MPPNSSTSIREDSSSSSNAFLALTVITLLLLMAYPWLIGLVSVSFVTGYFSLEIINDKLKPYLLKQVNSARKISRQSGPGSNTVTSVEFDPLLHTTVHDPVTDQAEVQGPCSACSVENCPRDVHRAHTKPQKPLQRVDRDFKIPPKLNASISRFCSAVFDIYITPHWAPYETRRQLRLAFTKLLIRFAERIQKAFIQKEGNPQDFCKTKVIPLLLYHLNQPGESKLSPMDEKRANWRIRRLSRIVLEKCLSEEERKCKLWIELCVNVLGDGVLWNLILMGRREIPELLESYCKEYFESMTPELSPVPVVLQSQKPKPIRNPLQSVDETDGATETENDLVTVPVPQIQVQPMEPARDVPFLLETFLDPCHDVEQPSSIVSRWRPTLNDVLQERDLLYCIIQYLREQGALEYLQAVMDESPDGTNYCKKILELEYFPAFCRSKIFLENLGLSRIDMGLEADSEESSPESTGLKKSSSHTRSVSYGGPASGTTIWKLGGQNIVDGFVIPSNSYSSATLDSLAFPVTGTVEPDSIFRRKQHVLEQFISKFYSSVVRSNREVKDILSDVEPRLRCGIDVREYDDQFHPYVTENVQVEKCDILRTVSETVTSRITRNTWMTPIISGWFNLLYPFINSKAEDMLDEQISKLLTVEHFVQFVDLVTDAFVSLHSNQSDKESGPPPIQRSSTATQTEDTSFSHISKSAICWTIRQLFDVSRLINGSKDNRDQIILFFVDILDVFVQEICTEESSEVLLGSNSS